MIIIYNIRKEEKKLTLISQVQLIQKSIPIKLIIQLTKSNLNSLSLKIK